MRISRVITKKGDSGTSQLSDGTTLPKADIHFECLGTLDELNAALGLVRSGSPPDTIGDEIQRIQNDLFNLGGELASPKLDHPLLTPQRITELETVTETRNQDLPPLKEFLLPGGTDLQSRIHMARAICRRTERRIAQFLSQEDGSQNWLIYLNRLSDYLFVLSRWVERGQSSENLWNKSTR